MANTAFPGQHTTEVTTTEVTVVPTIRFDPTYIKTIPGILKVAVMFLNILGFICISVSYHSVSSRGSWFCTVSMIGFWFTGILLVFYLFHVIEKFYKIPWLKIEFIYCAIWTFFYLLAASLAAGYGSAEEAFAAAAFFGFFAMVVYGYDAFLKYRGIKAGLLAQGDVTVQKQTVTA